MSNTKKTSTKMASTAAKVLTDPNSSKIKKRLAGSVLSQASPSKVTGQAMEADLSSIMKSSKYDDVTKALAASLLSQSDPER